ncbi:MAG TPA: NAD(P)-dependent oxidoreductase [Gammaproteobacteria bacterium]|nr:NAD(P)-dependent oxidoreductase [Gammaproteobacteria bacterium]
MGEHVAFLGLGVMGFPMAGWLSKAGHAVTVFNRTSAKAERWAETYRGRVADSPVDAVAGADFVFTCLGDDPDVREVVLGRDGVIVSMKKGAVYVDHTTASAVLAREIAAAGAEHGIHCLDAPVSGGQAGAENGKLTVMVGGDEPAFARAEPVIRSYSHNVRLIGPAGAGQLTKMVNQIAIAGAVQGLAEALNFALRAGLDPEAVIGAIGKGAAQSWQMDNRWKTMVRGEFEFGFAVEWMRKDLRICLDEARRNGAELPVAALVDQFYADVVGMGGRRWDTSSLIARLNWDAKR